MTPSITSIADAQRDMRLGYLSGAPGLLASSLAWTAAGIVAVRGSSTQAIWALFFGGMLIHPAAVLLSKAFGRPGNHTPGNPLGRLALEGTVILLLGLALAYGVALAHPEWFFAAMLLVIGGRYLTFSTLYGLRVYWACGAALTLTACGVVRFQAALPVGAFAGAAIEATFAALVLAGTRREHKV